PDRVGRGTWFERPLLATARRAVGQPEARPGQQRRVERQAQRRVGRRADLVAHEDPALRVRPVAVVEVDRGTGGERGAGDVNTPVVRELDVQRLARWVVPEALVAPAVAAVGLQLGVVAGVVPLTVHTGPGSGVAELLELEKSRHEHAGAGG